MIFLKKNRPLREDGKKWHMIPVPVFRRFIRA